MFPKREQIFIRAAKSRHNFLITPARCGITLKSGTGLIMAVISEALPVTS